MTDAQFISALGFAILAISFTAALLTARPGAPLPAIEPLDFTGTNRRRRDAKRFNEHVKLLGTFLNNLGVAIVVTAVFAPVVQGDASVSSARTFTALLAAGMLHTSAQLCLRWWKSEE